MSCNRCTGHCCKAFTFPVSPKELKKAADFEKGDMPWSDDFNGHHGKVNPDAKKFYPLHIYKGLSEINPTNGKKFVEGLAYDPLGDEYTKDEVERHMRENRAVWKDGKMMRHIYTCKNLGEDNNCKDYENRPDFCRSYPSHGACEYTECTSSENKAEE